MRRILVVDVETTGLEPETDKIIELGFAVWSVEYRSLVECHSFVFGAYDNPAHPWNGLQVEFLLTNSSVEDLAWEQFRLVAQDCDAIVGHQVDFDRSFIERKHGFGHPWICTKEDFRWPRCGGRSLVNTALAHGIAVVAAHRAIHDVLLLTRLFEVVDNVDARFDEALARALRPKEVFLAQEPHEKNDLLREHGFHWNGSAWWRRLAVEDAEALPFNVVREKDELPGF